MRYVYNVSWMSKDDSLIFTIQTPDIMTKHDQAASITKPRHEAAAVYVIQICPANRFTRLPDAVGGARDCFTSHLSSARALQVGRACCAYDYHHRGTACSSTDPSMAMITPSPPSFAGVVLARNTTDLVSCRTFLGGLEYLMVP